MYAAHREEDAPSASLALKLEPALPLLAIHPGPRGHRHQGLRLHRGHRSSAIEGGNTATRVGGALRRPDPLTPPAARARRECCVRPGRPDAGRGAPGASMADRRGDVGGRERLRGSLVSAVIAFGGTELYLRPDRSNSMFISGPLDIPPRISGSEPPPEAIVGYVVTRVSLRDARTAWALSATTPPPPHARDRPRGQQRAGRVSVASGECHAARVRQVGS